MDGKVLASVFRHRRRRGGKLSRSRFYSMRYKLPGELGYTTVGLGVSDLQVALSKRDEFVREKERELSGIVAPRALRDAAVKSMAEHKKDFLADLRARKRDAMYVYNLDRRLTRLLDECVWKLPRDVTADSFNAWRAGEDAAVKTLNDYLDAACALLNWMKRCGRVVVNPLLGGVEKVSTKGVDEDKRALSDAEVSSLLAVAGGCRAVYLTAVLTGLRRAELEGLRWGHVHLDALRPFLSVRASTTKNGDRATILLRDDLVQALRELRPSDAVDGDAVFSDGAPSMETFRGHLVAAGIPEVDADGRRVVFHSLRKTFNTLLQRAGVGERTVMEMMRVSDARLIHDTYMDAALLQTSDALDKIARFDVVPVAMRNIATGTDGKVTQKDTQRIVKQSPAVSGVVVPVSGVDSSEVAELVASCGEMSSDVVDCHSGENNWGSRIRT